MSSKKKSEKLTAKFSSQPKIEDESSNEPTPIILDESTEIIDFKVSDFDSNKTSKNSPPYTIRVKNLTDERLKDSRFQDILS